MFLLFGVNSRKKDVDFSQMMNCPVCGSYGRLSIVKSFMCFSLFFIPIFRWRKRYYAIMSCCHASCQLDPELGKAIEKGKVSYIDAVYLNFGGNGYRKWEEEKKEKKARKEKAEKKRQYDYQEYSNDFGSSGEESPYDDQSSYGPYKNGEQPDDFFGYGSEDREENPWGYDAGSNPYADPYYQQNPYAEGPIKKRANLPTGSDYPEEYETYIDEDGLRRVKVKLCSNCGYETAEEDFVYCPMCGHKF